MKCVVLCAGNGKRIHPYSKDVPKVLIKINDKPIIKYVIDYWKKYTNDFLFVVGYKKNHVINYVQSLPINSEFVEQKKLNGIADALLHVHDYVNGRFIVALGDCLYDGKFGTANSNNQYIGINRTKNTEDIKLNYSVVIGENNDITKVVEKPRKIVNDLCGMGIYLFDRKVFGYIKRTKPSSLRNEVEITDVIQNMIDAGENIKPLVFPGHYININFPVDIKKAEQIFI